MSAQSRVGRRFSAALLSFFLIGIVNPAALLAADAPDIFTVANVHVDESAAAAANARDIALARGERRAFDELMRRLTVRVDRDRLPRPGAETVAGLVQDIAIANEKNSRVRYIADITYRFKPQAIRNLMRSSGLRYAETRSKPVLVLPLYETAGTIALWEDPNPWRKVWSEAPERTGLVPLKVPESNLSDISEISAELAAAGDVQRLRPFAQRYGADAVIVARAKVGTRPDGRSEVAVTAVTYGGADRDQTVVTTLAAGANENLDALLERARRDIVELIEDNWKTANLIQFEQNSVMVAEMPLTSLREWVEAQKRFREVALIQRVDLVLMSREEARFNIFYLGDASQLKLALAQKDLVLTEGEGNWTLGFAARASQARAGSKGGP
jgi:hypothetical protein